MFSYTQPSITLKALFASALFFTTAISQAQLPDLGSPDLAVYDTQTEDKLGKAFVKSLNTEFPLSQDLDVTDFIRQVGHQVANNSGYNREFRFYVIDNPTINAFAGPDGVIGVHTGLITAVKTEAELASVIAHEIAHITQQHLSRRYLYDSTKGSATSVATLLAAILIGMVDPNAGMATLMSGQSLGIEKQLANSRQHENEADFTGIKILYDAGYNAHAMADFFGRLAESSRNNASQLPEILRTHPMTENRLVQAQNRALSLTPLRTEPSSETLDLIKLRLNTLYKLSGWMFDPIPENQPFSQSCYQLNLLELNKANSSTEHLNCLVEISQKQQNQPLYNNLILERLTDLFQKNTNLYENKNLIEIKNNAIKIARLQRDLHPEFASTNLNTAQLLASLGEPQAAINWLKTAHQSERYPSAKFKKLAELYNQTQQPILAYLSQAEAELAIFNDRRAKHFYDEAKAINEAQSSKNQVEIENFLTKYRDRFENLKKDETAN